MKKACCDLEIVLETIDRLRKGGLEIVRTMFDGYLSWLTKITWRNSAMKLDRTIENRWHGFHLFLW